MMEMDQQTAEAVATREAFADSARDFLGRSDQHARIRLARSDSPSFNRGSWLEAARAGWFLILVPEAEGGMGLGLAEAAAVVRIVGEHLCPEPVISGGLMPAVLLRLLPDGPRRNGLLSGLSSGDVVGVHRAFDAGSHVCIGQMISRLEAECILGALARRVKRIQLAGEPGYRLVNALRTLVSLPLRLTAA